MSFRKNYVSVVYDEKAVPRTDYPGKLARYIFERFDMKKQDRLLELGSGRGEFLRGFHDLGLYVTGVDINDYCQRENKDLKFALVSLSEERLPFEDNSYDYVFHKSLIEHFESPEKLMKEACRVLKPGGKLIILTPDWPSQMKIFYEDVTHKRPYDVRALKDTFLMFGLSDVHTERFYQLPLIWKVPAVKLLSTFIRFFMPVTVARKITAFSRIKFFRWSAELMVLGVGTK